jgi:threonine/homoserine/homoserine lactone efflux protein
MSLSLYLAFVLAVTILMLIPGPNVALIVANSLNHGARYGLMTVAGTSAAMVLQLALTGLGMTALLGEFSRGFEILRWVGVAYLLWLGISAWRAPPTDLTRTKADSKALGRLFWRGFLVSFTNPKTLLFYAAFFPQFVDARAPAAPRIALLAVTFVALAVLLDGGWALLAGRFRAALALNGKLRNRLTGGCLTAAALGLALARR